MNVTKYFEQQWDKMTLVHPVTKKEWCIEIDGNMIRSRLGTGKICIQEVDASSYSPPFYKAIQLVMAKLRKGFIYYNPEAKAGEAICHRFVGRSHTGFMPIATASDRDDFYVTRVVGDFEDEILVHYSAQGEVLSIKSLGAHSLTFSMTWDDGDIVYLDREFAHTGRKFYAYDVTRCEFVPKTDGNCHERSSAEMRKVEKMDEVLQLLTKNHRDVTIRRKMGLCVVEICTDNTAKPSMQIVNEFMVKSSHADLTKNHLILHSDYGVVSIYKI